MPKLRPTTTKDPLMRFIFMEQERLQLSTARFSRLSGVSPHTISELRHPDTYKGKRATLQQVRQLALALDFKFPDRLSKE